MITIEVRTTCTTCGGITCKGTPPIPGCYCGDECTTCTGTGTVVDAERSQWLRAVAEWVAGEVHFEDSDGECWCCGAAIGATPSAHAPGCIHELAKKVLEVA